MPMRGIEQFEYDDTLRLLYAFQTCIEDNTKWQEESRHTKHNRELAKKIMPKETFADYYFLIKNRFYACNVEQSGNCINCQMEEYDTFYDLTNQHLQLLFSYDLKQTAIIQLGQVHHIVDDHPPKQKS